MPKNISTAVVNPSAFLYAQLSGRFGIGPGWQHLPFRALALILQAVAIAKTGREFRQLEHLTVAESAISHMCADRSPAQLAELATEAIDYLRDNDLPDSTALDLVAAIGPYLPQK